MTNTSANVLNILVHMTENFRLVYNLGSVVAKKLGCRLKIKFRQLKEELNCPLCFTDSSLAKNPAGNLRFFSQ